MGILGPPLEATPRPSLQPFELGGIGIEEEGGSGLHKLPQRLSRYGLARRRALDVLAYLRSLDNADVVAARKAAGGLSRCGEYLHFRHYWTVDEVRLHRAEFCKQHLLCPLCAIRRGSKLLSAYLPKFEQVTAANPRLKPALLTVTVKNGEDLGERMAHLRNALRIVKERRRDVRKGNWGASQWGSISGAVGALEVTNKGNGWHPHAHMLVLLDDWIDQKAMAREWFDITGDSKIVGITRLNSSRGPAEAFAEVFKYALKFSDLAPDQVWTAARTLARQRLVFSFGSLHGVQVSEELTDEPLDGLPYADFIFRFLRDAYALDRQI